MPGLNWQKSSRCGSGDSCVHIAATPTAVHIAASADPGDAMLTTSRTAFRSFLHAVKTVGVGQPT